MASPQMINLTSLIDDGKHPLSTAVDAVEGREDGLHDRVSG
jgi:hypothetical protein